MKFIFGCFIITSSFIGIMRGLNRLLFLTLITDVLVGHVIKENNE